MSDAAAVTVGGIAADRARPRLSGLRRRPTRLPAGGHRGPWGFADMLEAEADPRHPNHAGFAEWLGEFDPAAFSVEAAEARARFAPKRTRKPQGNR